MYSITMNIGDTLTFGDDSVVQLDRIGNGRVRLMIDAPHKAKVVRGAAMDAKELQMRLQCLAQELDDEIATLNSDQSKELIGAFVSELFLSLARQSQREERRQKAAESVAAAKAKGVKLGQSRVPLPDNFDVCRQAWRSGELTLQAAADSCGMVRTTFQRAVQRQERRAGAATQ